MNQTLKRSHPALRLLALTLCLCLLGGCSVTGEAAPEKTSGVGFYFDTVVTITLYGADDTLLQDIWAACARYEALLSKTVPDSDVSRINLSGGMPAAVDPETVQILRRAGELSRATGGAFSVTIAPLTALWDFTGGTRRMPTEAQRLAALPLVDDTRIAIDDGAVTLPQGMQIDLGGIAKGYIADRVADLCRGRAQAAVISLGGNVYVLGDKPDGSPFRVGIRDPFAGEDSPLAVVSVYDATVVTSGTYERGFDVDGVWYHHILDPKTGLPARSDLVSATVICGDSMTADAIATACIVLGREESIRLMNTLGLSGVLIARDGSVTVLDAQPGTFGFNLLKEADVTYISQP